MDTGTTSVLTDIWIIQNTGKAAGCMQTDPGMNHIPADTGMSGLREAAGGGIPIIPDIILTVEAAG